MENPVQLTPRFTQAVDYARQVHVSLRKGTQVPYKIRHVVRRWKKEVKTEDEERATCNVILSASI